MTELYKNSATIHDRIAICVKLFGEGKNTIFAEKIGVSEGNIRGYIKGVIPKADVLEKIVTSVDISAEWLLTGKGEIHNSDFSRHNKANGEAQPIASPSEQQDQSPVIAQLLDTIKEQAEEIGRLKAHISSLENHKVHTAGDAPISETANVG
ncbi:MAG: helix-turn-helix domain-containing protein [Bacteroidaceae bacterium]|nr:helix-turn-helix domain-containing protein [Bacteroidaceae bacterium]